jgi:trans-aconitate methyltransferase
LGAIQAKYPNLDLEGVDLKTDCTTYAQKHYPNIQFQTTDYRKATFDQKPNVIFNSLFCHHFTDEQLIEMLRWMKENSTKGFFIADLHRHWLAYYSIKILTRLFSKSYLVKNDAPLSVLRGFRRSEWENLLTKAEVKNFKIRWQWAFRFLIVVEHEQN